MATYALWIVVFGAAMSFVFALKSERFEYFLFQTIAFAVLTATAVVIIVHS